MNDPKPHLDDVIDRIVDGGLSPGELREAVVRLDASPDHWRRCALAFIEAQALAEILRDADESRVQIADVIPFRRRTIGVRRLAYAASLAVLAFGLGWVGHGGTGNGLTLVRRGSPEPVDTADRRSPPLAEGRPAVHPWAGSGDPHPAEFGVGLPNPSIPPTEGLIAGEQIEIPLEDWLRDQPPPISSYEQAALEREGYRVEQHREIVLGTLDDGRLAALPVDQVELEYVGHLPL